MIGFSRTTVGNFGQCLLLVKDADATHTDPTKDITGCYKRGDIIEVLDTSKHDGNLVINPISAPFYLIRVTGIPKAAALRFQEPGYAPVELGGARNRRRLHGITIASLPASVQTGLTNTRYAVIQWNTLRLALKNKVTNATAV